MAFLRTADYPVYIQTLQLNQLTQNNIENRQAAELDAIEEISQYIRQKYDVDSIFTDTNPYSYLVGSGPNTYYANNLVELNEPAWAINPYTVGQLITYTDGNVYYCSANTAAEWVSGAYTTGQIVQYTDGKYYICILNTVGNAPPSNATYWSLTTQQTPGNTSFWIKLGYSLQLFYLATPYKLFDINALYPAGTIAFWKGKVYKSITASHGLSHQDSIQYDYTTDYCAPNYFPDDVNNGSLQWGVGVPYSVSGVYMGQSASAYNPATSYSIGNLSTNAGILWQSLTNTNVGNVPGADIINWQPIYWTAGDNRNRILVQSVIHLALFNLCSNISPNNVPMLREKNHIRTIDWLERVKKGIAVIDALTMPVLQPTRGGRILIGSRPKLNNNW